ncbi:MAG: hypothetical protein HQM13_16370 [SAR324 cluster bacterium]|nr:hypothetical protein [SAR324 cluster bacterium]
MSEILHEMTRQLVTLATHHISITDGLDWLESNARNHQEIIVVNVMRESYFEVMMEEQSRKSA